MRTRNKIQIFGCFFVWSLILSAFSPKGMHPIYYSALKGCSQYLFQPNNSFIWKWGGAFKITFWQMYHPSLLIWCGPFFKFWCSSLLLCKIYFALLFTLLLYSTFLFLHHISNKPLHTFLAVLLFSVLLPVFHQIWLEFYGNIYGLFTLILTGIIFFSSKKRYITGFIFAFFNGFGDGVSRLYTLPFLTLLMLFYGCNKKRVIIFGFNLFFCIAGSFSQAYLVNKTAHIISFTNTPIITLIYYMSFMADYFIYIIGFAGTFLLCAGFMRYLSSDKMRHFSASFYFLIATIFVITFSPHSYSNFWHNFIFVTTDVPWTFFLISLMLIISFAYSVWKTNDTAGKLCGTIIIIFPLILAFVMGVFPRIRTDPSSRHLLPLYPFMCLQLIEILFFLIKKFRGNKVWIIILLMGMGYRLIVGGYNSWREEQAWRNISANLRIHFLIQAKRKVEICYLTPQYYYINDYEDLMFPFESNLIKFVRINKIYTDNKIHVLELQKKCLSGRVRFIVLRFKPTVDPFYEGPGEKFFKKMKKFSDYYDDQLLMSHYAYMHTPYLTPLEKVLARYKKVYNTTERYTILPLFLNEVIHRIIYNIPFLIPYEVYSDIYEIIPSPKGTP